METQIHAVRDKYHVTASGLSHAGHYYRYDNMTDTTFIVRALHTGGEADMCIRQVISRSALVCYVTDKTQESMKSCPFLNNQDLSM
jgi:hypothetical protein